MAPRVAKSPVRNRRPEVADLSQRVFTDASKPAKQEPAAAGVSKKVDASSPFGGSFGRDIVSALILPFVAIAFWVLTSIEYFLHFVKLLLWPNSGEPSQPRTDRKGELKMDFFDPDTLTKADWECLRTEYVERGVPFVMHRAGGGLLSPVAPPSAAVAGAFHSGCIRVCSLNYTDALPGLDELCRKLFPSSHRAYWPLWFLGKYSQGKAHLDLGPHVFNCYFLRQGFKDVLLIPPEVSKTVPLLPGLDGLYIRDSESEAREYKESLPYYYRVDLPPQSMLCFNNTTVIHQFRNRQAADGAWPEALSIRIKHTCASVEPRVWLHMTSPFRGLKAWWRFTGVFVSNILGEPAEDRDAKYL